MFFDRDFVKTTDFLYNLKHLMRFSMLSIEHLMNAFNYYYYYKFKFDECQENFFIYSSYMKRDESAFQLTNWHLIICQFFWSFGWKLKIWKRKTSSLQQICLHCTILFVINWMHKIAICLMQRGSKRKILKIPTF